MACFYSIKKVSDRLYVGTRPYYALWGSVMAVVEGQEDDEGC